MKRRPLTREARPRSVAFGLGLLLIALLAAWLPSLAGLSPGSTQVWRGYHTLLIRSDRAGQGVMAEISVLFGPGVVTDLNATVDFWDFTGLDSVSVAGMDDRIDPSDPRHDRFMDGAAAYFRTTGGGGAWRIAYLPARVSAPRLYFRLVRLLGLPFRGAWRLIEFDPVGKSISLLALFILAFLQASLLEKSRRAGTCVALAGALLWVPFLLSGSVVRLALSCLLFMVWHQVMQVLVLLRGWDEQLLREERQPLLVFAGTAVGGLALLLLTTGFSLVALLGYLGPAAASLLLLAAVAQLWGRAHRPRRRRAKFEPIPIVRPSRDSSQSRAPAILLTVISVALVGLAPVMRGTSVAAPLPVLGARDFSWQSLSRLSQEKRSRRLPDYSDLVTHLAFQEALPFGREWRMPVSDERVYVREFAANPVTGAIVARQRTVKVFDSTWLRSVRGRTAPGSLEALLLAQGRPVAVAMQGPGRTLLRELPALLPILCALLAWLARDRGAGPLIRGILLRLNGVARRSQTP